MWMLKVCKKNRILVNHVSVSCFNYCKRKLPGLFCHLQVEVSFSLFPPFRVHGLVPGGRRLNRLLYKVLKLVLLDRDGDSTVAVVVVVGVLPQISILSLGHDRHVLVVLFIEIVGHDVENLRRRDGGEPEVSLHDGHNADLDEEITLLVINVAPLNVGVATFE